MSQVRRLIATLPEEGLLRERSWKQLVPLVKEQVDEYTSQFGRELVSSLEGGSEGMESFAIREAKYAGARFEDSPLRLGQPGVPTASSLALKASVNGQSIKRLFNLDGRSKEGAINKALFGTIERTVRTGFLQGTLTEDIADEMVGVVTRQGIPGVTFAGSNVAAKIRRQSTAVARTALQDMAREVHEAVYDANADALEGLEYEWTTALDSRVCPQCQPLDGERYELDEQMPQWPLHPNCRCQAVIVDPEDDEFANQARTAQQIRPMSKGAYKGKTAYKTPITVNGEQFYRRTITVTSDTPPPRYSDVLARWANTSEVSLVEAFGGGSPGRKRADWFKRQLDQFNKDPQQILESMLRGRPGETRWIPLPELLKK